MVRTKKARPKVVAAIPCFNAEPSVAAVVARARKHVDQVILIDCNSPQPPFPGEARSASGQDTGTTVSTTCRYRSSASLVDWESIPPTIFGVFLML